MGKKAKKKMKKAKKKVKKAKKKAKKAKKKVAKKAAKKKKVAKGASLKKKKQAAAIYHHPVGPPPLKMPCKAALAMAEATCRLHFWEAKNACTSDTIAPEKMRAAKPCRNAQARATRTCVASLARCAGAQAKQEAQRLLNEIVNG